MNLPGPDFTDQARPVLRFAQYHATVILESVPTWKAMQGTLDTMSACPGVGKLRGFIHVSPAGCRSPGPKEARISFSLARKGHILPLLLQHRSTNRAPPRRCSVPYSSGLGHCRLLPHWCLPSGTKVPYLIRLTPHTPTMCLIGLVDRGWTLLPARSTKAHFVPGFVLFLNLAIGPELEASKP